MGSEHIHELALALPREEFAKSVTSWFLVILDSGEEEPPNSFETVDASSAPRALFAPKPPSQMVHAIVKAEGNPYPDRIAIGRARNCDIVLRHVSVSKLHAHFVPQPEGQLAIVDVGSQVGTRVNGQALAPNQPKRLAPGAVLAIGRVVARLADAHAVWDLIRAQERLEEGSIPPQRSSAPPSDPRSSPVSSPPSAPRSSVPSSASRASPVPAPRSSVPSSAPRASPVPAPRSSVPVPGAAPRSASPSIAPRPAGAAPGSPAQGGRRSDPDTDPGTSGRRPGPPRRG